MQQTPSLALLIPLSGLAQLLGALLLPTQGAAVLLAPVAGDTHRGQGVAAAAVEQALRLMGTTARQSSRAIARGRLGFRGHRR